MHRYVSNISWDILEKEVAVYSSIVVLPGESRGQKSLGGFQSIALQRVAKSRTQ